MVHPFILNKSYHEWPERFISEKDIKKIGKLKADDTLHLKVQGGSELITVDNPVDLGREGVEQIYSHHPEKYQFILNGKLFFSPEAFITEGELRSVGQLAAADQIFFKLEGPDSLVTKGQKIDLRPFAIEEFYSRSPKLVSIKINGKSHPIAPGKYTVAEIKTLGGVSLAHTLSQLIDGDMVPLKDDAVIDICGGEIFLSNPKEGSSS